MASSFSSANLRKLLQVNFYQFSQKDHIVFCIRGASADVKPGHADFKDSYDITESTLNYETCNCLIGIWNPVKDKIALFSGSTVPNLRYIKKQAQGVARANCMMSGYYDYYAKGFHSPKAVANAHEGLRQATNIVLRRSYNDFVFTNADTIEVGNPHDNIHAAYISDLKGNYSSAGCQVVAGQPKCAARGDQPNTLYWKAFYDAVHGLDQQRFPYALFRFADVEAIATHGNQPMEARLRFGSQGAPVLALQQALASTKTTNNPNQAYFFTNQDGAFGKNTLRAVLDFQTDAFTAANADGVVGPKTAQALGITLPCI